MSINLHDIIDYGSAKFKVVRNVTSENMSNFSYVPVPLGSIIPYSVNSLTPPKGFLFCDGAAVSRTTYKDLFDVIGTTYGVGDNSTTFNLPNLTSGEFLESSNTAGITRAAGLPNITGQYDLSSDIASFINSSIAKTSGAFTKANTLAYPCTNRPGWRVGESETQDVAFDASLSNSIYGASNTVQPKSLTVKYIIKAFNPLIDDDLFVDANELNNTLNNKFDITQNFTIIYPNGGTKQTPANITVASTYIMNNPFPGYAVSCQAEIKLGSGWYVAPFASHYNSSNGNSSGSGYYCYQIDNGNDIIILRTGSGTISGSGSYTYTIQPNTVYPGSSSTFTSAPCRIKVWKIGKI